jgi:RluA family pseudouridine synthase
MIKEKHLVVELKDEIRIYNYLPGIFNSLVSRKSIKKALKKGLIIVDGKSVSSALWLKKGMLIELVEEDQKVAKIYDLPLEVVFEDDHLAVVNKPAGLVSSANQFRTLQNALAGNLKPSKQVDAIAPVLVHRLDSATSGLLIVAKTASTALRLGELLAQRKVKKKYEALLIGEIEDEGQIDEDIEGKEAITEFKKLASIDTGTFGVISRVVLYPKTGRTHQLRIHMMKKACPILGDRIYGSEDNNVKGRGLFLSAVALEFQHPTTFQTLKLEIPTPGKFEKYWSILQKRNDSRSKD